MASYELVFKKSVAKDLRAFPKKDVKRLLQRIRALAEDPRPAGCEKLTGRNRYRVRQGAYRILYEMCDAGRATPLETISIIICGFAKA